MLSVIPEKINNSNDKKGDELEGLITQKNAEPQIGVEQVNKLKAISNQISSGANVFLWSEYFYLAIFIVIFGGLIAGVAEIFPGKFYTTIAFVIGAITSIICGYIGMMIATSANYRTAYKA